MFARVEWTICPWNSLSNYNVSAYCKNILETDINYKNKSHFSIECFVSDVFQFNLYPKQSPIIIDISYGSEPDIKGILQLQLNFEPHLSGTLVSNPAVLEATHKCLCLEPNAARRPQLSLTLHRLDSIVVEHFEVSGILNVGRVMEFQHNSLSPFWQGIIGLRIKTRLFGHRAFLVEQ
jgi:hypothetical protein